MLNQFLANADAETKERALARLDMGDNPNTILAQLEYEMELLMAEAQTGMKGPDDPEGKNTPNYMRSLFQKVECKVAPH
ncbi:MAG: hypothetical protein U5Q03_17980 [Bacteroidota bacterium]|nr:hypothetical protein [Bacteroidota bacterium]